MKSTHVLMNRLIGIKEVARWLGVTETTLYKMTYQRKIPHVKVGRLTKFDPVKLEEWIQAQTVMPMPEKRYGR